MRVGAGGAAAPLARGRAVGWGWGGKGRVREVTWQTTHLLISRIPKSECPFFIINILFMPWRAAFILIPISGAHVIL